MGLASKMPKGPLGVPLMSSSPSQVDIMAKFESGYRSSSPIRNPLDVEDRALPPQPAPNRPLSEFVKRIEGKIRQRAEATKKELQKKSTSANRPMVTASIAPGNTNMTEKEGSHIDRAVSPSFPDHTPLPQRALLSRPTSKQQNYRTSSPVVSRSTSAMMNRSRIATPLSVMSMDLVPPPPLWEDSSFNGGPVVAPRRAPPPAASSTSIHQWVDARQAVLSEVATAISPVESKKQGRLNVPAHKRSSLWTGAYDCRNA
ncbi:Hypothetical protein, putative [Bodo saltans]|uniref:Uncharacterized protein n=1 Tax=Bodo saltans TaxID=75058 RepID=A0A0S4JDU6_BODSA|nr:Hypothetical protein, putative [Bodo saltans]|eukprot:CUG89735.1 Hypothetical protein, putative [Bodo saltans]